MAANPAQKNTLTQLQEQVTKLLMVMDNLQVVASQWSTQDCASLTDADIQALSGFEHTNAAQLAVVISDLTTLQTTFGAYNTIGSIRRHMIKPCVVSPGVNGV